MKESLVNTSTTKDPRMMVSFVLPFLLSSFPPSIICSSCLLIDWTIMAQELSDNTFISKREKERMGECSYGVINTHYDERKGF